MPTGVIAAIPKYQFSDAAGDPMVGGTLTTYLAGTTTPETTYQNAALSIANTNPITLDSRGECVLWLNASKSYKFLLKNAAGVTQWTVDDISGSSPASSIASASEWTAYSGTPTYLTATTFSLSGDQTTTFQVNRRVKSTNTGGTIYSTVSASSYSGGSGLTTVTVVNDSGVLDSGLSAVSYGLISVTNTSLPIVPIRIKTLTATTSGTSIDFTSIPAWVKRITLMFNGVSTTGTSIPMVQIGDSGGIENLSYTSAGSFLISTGIVSVNGTTGFPLTGQWSPASVLSGSAVLTLMDAATNLWALSSTGGYSNTTANSCGAGAKALSATLDRIRLTTVGGADTFDAGSVNVLYE